MKKCLFLLFVGVAQLAFAQKKVISYYDYPALAKLNLSYLDKRGSIASRVDLREHVFVLTKSNKGGDEVWIPWKGMAGVIQMLEIGDHHTLYDGYVKTIKQLSVDQPAKVSNEYHPVPVSFDELIIALDPGHFAGNFKQAIAEQKYVKIHGQDVDMSGDVQFYEAFLNDVTCYLVKLECEKLNAKVYLTKEMGQNSLGKTFSDWYANDFKKDLVKARNAGDIDQKYFDSELKADSMAVFNHFFRFVEFRKRIDFINNLRPSLTIAMHYNAKEGGKRDADGFLKPVKENYSMAFVPGAFLSHELERPSEKLDFIRLLLSSDLDKSMRLAHLILQAEQNTMGIPPVQAKDHALDDQVCSVTPYEGVYCRNLALTRTVRGPIVYLEALLQDNEQEVKLLSKRTYEINHPQYGKIMVPERCVQVANAIVKGITYWLEENKSYASVTTEGSPSKQ